MNPGSRGGRAHRGREFLRRRCGASRFRCCVRRCSAHGSSFSSIRSARSWSRCMIGLPAKIMLYSTEIYLASEPRARRPQSRQRLQPADPGGHGVLGIYAYRRATRRRVALCHRDRQGIQPEGRLARPMAPGPCTGIGVVILLLVAGLPILVLVWNAFMPYPQAPSLRSLKLLTVRNFAAALDYGPAVQRPGEQSLCSGCVRASSRRARRADRVDALSACSGRAGRSPRSISWRRCRSRCPA